MRRYVCGFLFSADGARVVLIRKNRPAWQAGKLNGVGGKIEAGETPLDAIRREFAEETGLAVADWTRGVVITGAPTERDPTGWEGTFFRATGDVDAARSMTDEAVVVATVRPLPDDTIPNLRWMVPLLLDVDVAAGAYRVTVTGGDA